MTRIPVFKLAPTACLLIASACRNDGPCSSIKAESDPGAIAQSIVMANPRLQLIGFVGELNSPGGATSRKATVLLRQAETHRNWEVTVTDRSCVTRAIGSSSDGTFSDKVCTCAELLNVARTWGERDAESCEFRGGKYKIHAARTYTYDRDCSLSSVEGTFRGCYIDAFSVDAYRHRYFFESSLGTWPIKRIEEAEARVSATLPKDAKAIADEHMNDEAFRALLLNGYTDSTGKRIYARVGLELNAEVRPLPGERRLFVRRASNVRLVDSPECQPLGNVPFTGEIVDPPIHWESTPNQVVE